MTGHVPPRRFGSTRAAIGVALALPLVLPWLLRRPGGAAAHRLERRFHRRLAQGFGIRVAAHGTPAPAQGTLYVANHVSWADIFALGSLLDAVFVARHDIAGWPLLGPLARRRGILFVDRGQRRRARGQADAVGDALARGEGVILFPEGTTSDGRAVAPLRTSLFEAAAQAARIQPVAISYAGRDGCRLDDARLGALAWTDDEPFAANARAFARSGATVDVHFLEPFDPRAIDRKQAAERSRVAIDRAYRAARALCDAPQPGSGGTE